MIPEGYEINWSAWISGLAVCASLAAAGVALWGSWRANKIAEKNLSLSAELEIIKFREQWISDVRNQMCIIINLLSTAPDILPKREVAGYELRQAITRLLLLLPHDDNETTELMSEIDLLQNTYIGMMSGGEKPNPAALILLSKDTLKREWERLKTDIYELRDK